LVLTVAFSLIVMPGTIPLVSGLILWTRCMALILLVSKRLGTIWTGKRINTVRHYNGVFHDLLKHVPWEVFKGLVSEHGADKSVRRLTTKDQLIALLYGQLSGPSSLREITGGLASHSARLYHVGGGMLHSVRHCPTPITGVPPKCSPGCSLRWSDGRRATIAG
jgi:hypothetical protein